MKSKELDGEDKVPIIIVSICCGLIMIVTLLYFINDVNNIKVKGTIDCSSGKIDIDFQSDWKFQELNIINTGSVFKREKYGLKTYFTDYFPRTFALEGIDDITCRMEYELEGNMIGLRKLGE